LLPGPTHSTDSLDGFRGWNGRKMGEEKGTEGMKGGEKGGGGLKVKGG